MVCLTGGCDVVRMSRYAHFCGYSTPLFGVVMYAAMAALIFAQTLLPARLVRVAQLSVCVIAAAGTAVSAFLTRIEASVLHVWCTWCVLSAICVTLALVLAVWDLFASRSPRTAAPAHPTRRLAIIFAVAVVIGAPALWWLIREGIVRAKANPQTGTPRPEVLVRPNSHIFGNRNAKVTVVEFGDFECPACGMEEPTVHAIRARYGDRIRFVFRHLPLRGVHPQSQKAAEASECAADQDKFWGAVELLYEKQTDLSVPALKNYASQLGLDRSRFDRCLDSGEMAGRVQQDVKDAHDLKVDRTPTFFIGDLQNTGPIPFPQFAKLIDQELANSGVPAESHPAASVNPAGASLGAGSSGGLGSLGSNAFSTGTAPACSEEEAKKRQPVLIHTDDAQKLHDEPNVIFVDVRSPKDFATGHIPHAVNIPVEQVSAGWKSLPQGKAIVFYESGRSPGDICGFARAAGRTLIEAGVPFDHVKVYQEGLAGWEKAHLPTEPPG
jgi:protein-disulfide isomerase/rhodanese-related sulfurtransferase